MAQGAKKPARTKEPDRYARDVAERIGKAFKQYNADARRGLELSQSQLGLRVAEVLGITEAPTQAAVSRWMSPTNPATPDNPTIEAIAKVLDVDPAWIAFGSGSD